MFVLSLILHLNYVYVIFVNLFSCCVFYLFDNPISISLFFTCLLFIVLFCKFFFFPLLLCVSASASSNSFCEILRNYLHNQRSKNLLLQCFKTILRILPSFKQFLNVKNLLEMFQTM